MKLPRQLELSDRRALRRRAHRANCAEAVKAAGITRPLFVTDPQLAQLPMTSSAVASLDAAGLSPKLFHDIRANPIDSQHRGRRRRLQGRRP